MRHRNGTWPALVDNLLIHAQLEMGETRINPQVTDIAELVSDLRSFFAPIVAARSLEFIVTIDGSVPAALSFDPLKVRQVLINLLDNACKYTSAETISLTLSWRDGALVSRVIDTGPGIDPETMDKLFVPFHRASGTTQSGAGLGLSISRQLVDLMGGTLELESRPGHGTEVCVTIPVGRAAIPGKPPRSGASGRRGEVLYVEDDGDVFDIIALYLQRAGYAVTHVARPLEAREVCRELQPDVVLLDLNLPGMDGCALAEQFRGDGYSNPIVMMTASSLHSDRARAFASGCNAFLVKPILPAELLRTLEKSCGRSPIDEIENLKRAYRASLADRADELSALRGRLHEGQARMELAAMLHKIAGASAVYGIRDVSDRARSLEISIAETHRDDAPELANLPAALDSLIDTIRRTAAG